MKYLIRLIGFLALISIIFFETPFICYAAEKIWVTKEDMSITRAVFQTEEINGKIYAVGGNSSSSSVASIEVYDPLENKWTTLPPMSTKRQWFQTEVINGKIYAIGGSGYIASTEVYDPTTNKWTTLSPMNFGRHYFQTEVINGKIYAIGGASDNRIEVYDPLVDKWTVLAPMSASRLYMQTEVIDGKIYVIGGMKGDGTYLTSTEVYDPITNSWTTLAPIHTPRIYFKTEVIDGKIYAIGGYNTNSYLDSTEEYDPTINKWTTLASMSTKRGSLQTKVISGRIYALGGENDSSVLGTAEEYDPLTNKWTILASMSKARYFHQTEVLDGKLYIIGGIGNPKVSISSVESYIIPLEELSQPTNLYAISDNVQVKLTWSTIKGATKYNVKRSETPGGPYKTINSVSESTYLDTDVVKDKTYYYVVSAIVSGTESINSNEAFAILKTNHDIELTSPKKLSAIADLAQITLTWDAVDGATNYNVKRSEVPGGPYTTISSVSGSAITYSDTDVVKGKTYYYVVSASASGTESQNSNEASATIDNSSTIDGNRAILLISFKDGKEKEYDLSAKEADAFVTWYDKRSDGTGKSYYYLPKYSNVKPFISRKEYIKFDSIESFEIKSYNE